MTNGELIDFIESFGRLGKDGKIRYGLKDISSDPRWQTLKTVFAFIPEVDNLKPYEFLFCLKNNITTGPNCLICKKAIPFKIERGSSPQYIKKYCSIKCFNKDPIKNLVNSKREKSKAAERLKQRKKTVVEKYGSWENRPGVNNFKESNNRLQSDPDFRKKRALAIKKTNLIRYGIEHLMKSRYIANQRRQLANKTCLHKYGVKNSSQRHLRNTQDLSKEFIKNKFLDDNNLFLLDDFIKYYNCGPNFAYSMLKEYSIDYKYRSGGFQADKPAILYYLWDPVSDMYKIGISNNTLEERFGKSFLKSRGIEVLLEEEYTKGYDALQAEHEILEAFSYCRMTNTSWPETKGGKTEFFNKDILQKHKGHI